jgi:hypothetical protein
MKYEIKHKITGELLYTIPCDRSGRFDLADKQLQGADLRGLNLSAIDLMRANLDDADLTGAQIREANLSHASLQRADLSGADLSYADLDYARLDGANLSGAKLVYTRCEHASFQGANLQRTDLQGADLVYALFSGADLTETRFTGANLLAVIMPVFPGIREPTSLKEAAIAVRDWLTPERWLAGGWIETPKGAWNGQCKVCLHGAARYIAGPDWGTRLSDALEAAGFTIGWNDTEGRVWEEVHNALETVVQTS